MLVVLYLLLLPFLSLSKIKITDLSYFPCYEGGFESVSGDTECKELSIDFSNSTCERFVFIVVKFGIYSVTWSRTQKNEQAPPVCGLYTNRFTKVAGDTLDYYGLLEDMAYLAQCDLLDLRKLNTVMQCIKPLKQAVQECYSGVLLENGKITNKAVQLKNGTARCGWWIVYIFNKTTKTYGVKVISSHIHHTKERHSCWSQMSNLIACVCEGDGCNNNIELLMERLMEMPFDLDRTGPMVFHNHNELTTNQLTAEIAKTYSTEHKCDSNCSIIIFYKYLSTPMDCEIVKFGFNGTQIIKNLKSSVMHCTFKGCSKSPNFQYLSYLTKKPIQMPFFCRKPVYVVDIVNYVTDDGWDVYWTEPKPLRSKLKARRNVATTTKKTTTTSAKKMLKKSCDRWDYGMLLMIVVYWFI